MTLCNAACFTNAGFFGAIYFLPFLRLTDFGRLEGDLLCRPLVFPWTMVDGDENSHVTAAPPLTEVCELTLAYRLITCCSG